jgi:hypothetical protein
MKLAELLANTPEPMREEIGRHNGWTGAGHDWGRLLGSEESVSRLNDSLFELERKVLETIVRRFGHAPFDWAKLEKAGQKEMSGAALKVGLIRLSRKGILFALRRKWGEADYVLPEDGFPLWRKLLTPISEQKAIYAGNDVVSDSPFRPSIAVQMLSVLAYIAKEDVMVTQKGGAHKRHAGKLAALVPVRDEELKPVEGTEAIVKSEYGSVAVDFLCGAGLRLGILDKGSERLTVRPRQLALWLSQTEKEMEARLYSHWKSVVATSDPWLHHASSSLEQMPEGSWILLHGLDGQLREAGIGGADVKPGHDGRLPDQTGKLLSWTAPLEAWGWAETAATADGRRLFRWLRKPRLELEEDRGQEARSVSGNQADDDRPRLFVQPDFELIVPPDCSYRVRWELEMIAERIRHEHIAVYRLTRETVMRALNHGRSADATVRFLEGHAKYGVPENVKTAISQWGDRQSQLRVETATVLRLRDETTAKTICRDERIAPLLGEALGPTAWIVRSDKASELRALLEKIGYSPGGTKHGPEVGGASYPLVDEAALQKPEQPVMPEDASVEGELPAKGLIYSKAAVQYYDRERIFPLIEDVYPGLQEVPSMWLKDCRTYHVSTRKLMIQKALDWKACLRLRKAGADTLFIPLRLDGIRDDWAVTGFEQTNEVRLAPDQWEEMQLILPGINDESR